MASHLVSQHQIGNLASPVNSDPGDATVVLGNDNTIIDGYNPHDSDGTIHLQSSSAADFAGVAAGTEGRKWMTQDAGAVYLYYDNGAAWVEVNYQRKATNGQVTITSTTAPQLTVAYDGSNHLQVSVSSAGAVTLNATGASAGFTFADVVIGKDGSAAAPSFVFSSDPTTGLYRSASETIGFAAGGGLRASLNASAFTTASGVAIVVTGAGITATTGTFGTNAAVGGIINLPNGNAINARNAANDGNLTMITTVSDTVNLGGGATAVEAAVILLTPASAAVAGSGFRLPHGTAPNSPTNGDMWTTTAGLFVRINGATVGPLS